jgi:hypothetical protein
MRKYALVAVGIVAVFLTGTPPGSDGCAMAASSDHACCAQAAPEPSPGCCSSDKAATAPTEPDHRSRCDCVHPAPTRSALVSSGSPPAPDKTQSAEPNAEAPSSGLLSEHSVRTVRQVRNHPPPSVFLLDCAFLI